MTAANNIFLIGPMGSGKTSVGRRLARRLGLEFIDSDAEIRARTGVEIAEIFEKEGESGFRAREAAVIDELTHRSGVVLATGGGAILDPDSRERLRSRGHVVYLRTTVDQQLQRTRRGGHRPLLANPDPRGTLESLLRIRAPLYEGLAATTIDTSGRGVKSVVEELIRHLAPLSGA